MNASDRKAAYAVLTRIKDAVDAGHEVRFLPGLGGIVVGVGPSHFHMPVEWSGTMEEFIEILDKNIRVPENE